METKQPASAGKRAVLKGPAFKGHFVKKKNIGRLLLDAARNSENGVTFILDRGEERFLSYREIERRALLRLGGLQRRGVKPGDFVLIVLDDNEEFVLTFWACVLGGIVPVPLAHPAAANASGAVMDKVHAVWNTLGRPVILTDGGLASGGIRLFGDGGDDKAVMVETGDLEKHGMPGEMRLAGPDAPAFIQFSSGSTSDPKGVILTHDNLLANIDQMTVAAGLSERDRSLAWMPYHHDMGLIGFHITMTANRIQQYNMTPFRFVKRPLLWLETLSKHRITITGSPNFGYRIVLERVGREQISGLDLSSVRLIFNGAEPISVPLMREFMAFLAPCGLRESAMYPVYGMAEACLAVSFPPRGTPPAVRAVSRKVFVTNARVIPVPETDPDALLLADEGHPMPGMKIRIVNEKGNVVSEGRLGEIQISGRNVTKGYVNNPEATARSIRGGWLSTGDMGFIRDGRLVVAGRIKDLIFVNGQNVFAHDIETAIDRLEGVKPGKMVVAGWHDGQEGREKVALFSTQRVKEAEFADFYARVLRHVNETAGIAIDEVVLVQRIPKTTSGKLQRYKLVTELLGGAYEGRRFSRDCFIGRKDAPSGTGGTDDARPAEPAGKPAAAAGLPAPPGEREPAGNIVREASGPAGRTEAAEPVRAAREPIRAVREPDRAAETAPDTRAPGRYMETIRNIWGNVLNLPPGSIDPDAPFLSLGGTSLKAIRVLAELEDALGLELSHDILIRCRTVRDMDAYLTELGAGRGAENAGRDGMPPAIPPSPARGGGVPPAPAPAEAGGRDIAVIGMVCRFPDASSPEAFWDNILRGRVSISEVPGDRWNVDDYYRPEPAFGYTSCRTGAFLENPYGFDAALFGISGEEAAVMDPQQRIVLELVHELFERTGGSAKSFAGSRTGLFIGAGANTYLEYHLRTLNRLGIERMASFAALPEPQKHALLGEWKQTFGETGRHPNLLVGNLLNMIAARASQTFNLTGPSLVVDTACSSSLVAIHLACESLRKGECDAAIAGGVNLLLTPTPYLYFSFSGALSPSGQSRVFDAEADGFVPGEGAGLVMLKPLDRALADGDDILAVIKASAVNNDGHSIGVMAPNPDGQREVIRSVYAASGLHPGSIQYIEAHGTGTKVGDPSEIRALDAAFRPWNLERRSIALGSVKSNIGHLLAAAGVAGFIKTVMALRNRTIPPCAGIRTANPLLRLDQTPFRLPAEPAEWPVPAGRVRRASINSFGFGGTNCHMVLEEAPARAEAADGGTDRDPGRHLLCVSANTPRALKERMRQLAGFIRSRPGVRTGDVCLSENRRSVYKYRVALQAGSAGELLERLEKAREAADPALPAAVSGKAALMLTGQGSQYVGMARELYERLPAFRKAMDDCSAAFRPHLGTSVAELIYGEDASEERLADTAWTQPAVFAVDYALGRLLMDMGFRPAFLMGHSVGEWAAACLAGAVSLEDAARLVALRGKLMGEIKSGGKMAAVFANRDKVEFLIDPFRGELWIAGYNVTHQVVSGSAEAVDRFVAAMAGQQVPCRTLNVSQAFHSPLMKPMLEAFRRELEKVAFRKPAVPIVSNVTGRRMDGAPDAEYWLDHILAPVRFEQSLKHVVEQGVTVLVECGPDHVLARMAEGLENAGHVKVFSAIRRRRGNLEHFLDTLGALFALGFDLDWDAFYAGTGCRKLALPPYPYERIRYGPDVFPAAGRKAASGGARSLLFHEWEWREAEGRKEEGLGPGAVVVFGHDDRLAGELEKLAPRRTVCRVAAGDAFGEHGADRFTIRPDVPGDYARLLDRLREPVAAVVHVWNAERLPAADPLDAAAGILHLAGQLKSRPGMNPRMVVVTDRAFVLRGQADAGPPHQAVGATFAQVLRQETGLRLSVLDLEHPLEEGRLREAAAAVWDELANGVEEEALAAVRGGKRWVRTIRPAPAVRRRDADIRDGETYVITGGAGDIGIALARVLAGRARVNLALAGRTPYEELALERKERLEELRLLGANVEYAAVDVADERAVNDWLDRVRRTFGPIHGVIHAAGVVGGAGRGLCEKSREEIAGVLAPKVRGTIHLDLATRRDPLKFFVLLSSISASKQEWAAGLGDYAAANAFLDAYSQRRALDPEAPGLSLAINYSLWENTGLGHSFGSLSVLALKRFGLKPLKPAEAAEAFLAALECAGRPVVHLFERPASYGAGGGPAKGSAAVREEAAAFGAAAGAAAAWAETAAAGGGPAVRAPSAAGRVTPVSGTAAPGGTQAAASGFAGRPPVLTAEDIRRLVRETVCEYTKTAPDELDEGANFQTLGVDSAGALIIADRLGQKLNTVLYPTLLFEYQTPDALSRHLAETHAGRPGEAAGGVRNAGPATAAGPGTGEPRMPENRLSVAEDRPPVGGERLPVAGTPAYGTASASGAEESRQDIAIIGIGLRFPGASTLDEYWQLLVEGRSVIRDVPADRWTEEDLLAGLGAGFSPGAARGGFIDRPYDFDPLFFGISPNEAEMMDPQQRLFLEISWEALQQAGYGGRHRPDRIGVFVGSEQNGYMDRFAGYCAYRRIRSRMEKSAAFRKLSPAERDDVLRQIAGVLQPSELLPDAVAGNGLNEIAARVSHCFNLTGPSLVVNTACSSSLVALHMACEGLRSGQMDMALAGGVHLNLNAMPFISLSRLTALSPTGVCAPFDRRANGMVLSEGAGVVLLKPLEKALKDRDHIFAVIKGSAVNNDGRSQGITAPRPQGQAEAIRAAYERSGIHPETVSYIETHGTGTPLGDPIEIEGMTRAFRHFTDKTAFCGIGSVKSSVGHMLAASGMASLIKVVLAMNNRLLPHTVNFEEPNPNIDFASTPFHVVSRRPRPWEPAGGGPLRAAVNAFGFGGTNAHVILEEAPRAAAETAGSGPDDEPRLVVLSGRTGEALSRVANRLIAYAKAHPAVPLASLSHSLNLSQKPMAQKAAFVVRSSRELLDRLEAVRAGKTGAGIAAGRSNPNRETGLYLVFGDDFEWTAARHERLSVRFPAYAAALQRFGEQAKLLPADRAGAPPKRQVERLAAMVALGNLFAHFGMKPAGLLGAGTGALGAGILAGAMSPGQALERLAEAELDAGARPDERVSLACFRGVPVYDASSGRPPASGMSDRDVAVVLGWPDWSGGQAVHLPEESGEGADPVVGVLTVLAKCYAAGVPFDLSRLSEGAAKVPLPTYPFERSVFKAKPFRDVGDAGQPAETGRREPPDVERLMRDLQLLGIPAGSEGERA